MSSAGSSAGAADGSGAEVQVQHVAAGEAIACQLQQAGAAAEIQEGTQFLIAGEDGQAYPVQGMITIPVGSGMYQVWTLAHNSLLFLPFRVKIKISDAVIIGENTHTLFYKETIRFVTTGAEVPRYRQEPA